MFISLLRHFLIFLSFLRIQFTMSLAKTRQEDHLFYHNPYLHDFCFGFLCPQSLIQSSRFWYQLGTKLLCIVFLAAGPLLTLYLVLRVHNVPSPCWGEAGTIYYISARKNKIKSVLYHSKAKCSSQAHHSDL